MSSLGSVTNSQMATSAYGAYEKSPAANKEVKENVASKEDAVVYGKAEDTPAKATYSINKMSQEDRAAFVQQLKADQASREASLVNIVKQMMSKQSGTFEIANSDGTQDPDAMWKFLASGKYEVDEATRKQAQEDISEDGYWGVKQTSQRLFDFASALAGDDEEKMKQMQKAMQKGFDEATKSWGKDLPQLSQDTLAAANKLFEDYYASKQAVEA